MLRQLRFLAGSNGDRTHLETSSTSSVSSRAFHVTNVFGDWFRQLRVLMGPNKESINFQTAHGLYIGHRLSHWGVALATKTWVWSAPSPWWWAPWRGPCCLIMVPLHSYVVHLGCQVRRPERPLPVCMSFPDAGSVRRTLCLALFAGILFSGYNGMPVSVSAFLSHSRLWPEHGWWLDALHLVGLRMPATSLLRPGRFLMQDYWLSWWISSAAVCLSHVACEVARSWTTHFV